MHNLIKLWRGIFDFVIYLLEKVRSLADSKAAKSIHPEATTFWPYDLVIEKSYCDKLHKEGKSKFYVEDGGSYVMGTVVGYDDNNFEKVVVSFVNPYEYKKPIYRTLDSDDLMLIDSPLNAITKLGKMKSTINDMIEQIEKTEEEDPNGGGYLH